MTRFIDTQDGYVRCEACRRKFHDFDTTSFKYCPACGSYIKEFINDYEL